MANPPWRPIPVDDQAVTRFACETGVRALTARILLARGVGPAEVGKFLQPRLADLRPPTGMADLDVALGRIEEAIAAGQIIGIFGDYDVDGVTTAATLATGLDALGAKTLARVANRASGYGLSPEDAKVLVSGGAALVITGDCGTSDHDAVSYLKGEGIDTIVIDHHQVPAGPHPALALINPHRDDDTFAFKGLASCGVAFYLVAALRTRMRSAGNARAGAFDPRTLLDFVALGTVADVVPLVDENRILVAHGLRELGARKRPGLRALMAVAEVDPRDLVDEITIGFRLAPRLNAAGRLGDANLSLRLLLAPDAAQAQALAEELDACNKERQQIQGAVMDEAQAQADAQWAASSDLAALVLWGEGWHPGVVGIVAAKLVDKYSVPAIVIGMRDGRGRGSARTVPNLNLYQALCACGDFLDKFGGHAMAAGMSVSAPHLEAFRTSFCAAIEAQKNGTVVDVSVAVDAIANPEDLDEKGVEELARLGPFGCANKEPLVAIADVNASSCRVVGQRHLQLTLVKGHTVTEAIAFGFADQAPARGDTVSVLGVPEMNSFRGVRRPRLRVRHLYPAITEAKP